MHLCLAQYTELSQFAEALGEGAFKKVFKAFDTQEGVEVAWNDVSITGLPKSERSRVIGEVKLLSNIKHPKIINFFGSWFNKETNKVVFITEIVTSGNLRSYFSRLFASYFTMQVDS